MSREILPYTDDASRNAERAKDLTSTDVAALFGVSPYLTPFELWHRKRGALQVDDVENERTRWGNLLQDAIARGFAEERGKVLRRMDEYMRVGDLRIGSSFDFGGIDEEQGSIWGPGLVPGTGLEAQFLVEVKNVDSLAFRRGWIETDFGLEAPAHIELQAQHQLLVADVRKCYIVALVGGNTLHVLERERDDVIAQRILDASVDFWRSTEPPAPDFRQDAETISRLYGYSSAGKVIDADEYMLSLMAAYKEYGAVEAAAEKQKKACKAELLTLIGDAEKVIGEGYSLSAKTIGDKEIAAHTRKGYRDFRIHERSSK